MCIIGGWGGGTNMCSIVLFITNLFLCESTRDYSLTLLFFYFLPVLYLCINFVLILYLYVYFVYILKVHEYVPWSSSLAAVLRLYTRCLSKCTENISHVNKHGVFDSGKVVSLLG